MLRWTIRRKYRQLPRTTRRCSTRFPSNRKPSSSTAQHLFELRKSAARSPGRGTGRMPCFNSLSAPAGTSLVLCKCDMKRLSIIVGAIFTSAFLTFCIGIANAQVMVPGGGTGLTSIAQGAFPVGGTSTLRLTSTTSPTFGYVTATNTSATSTLPRTSIGTALYLLGDYITNVSTWFATRAAAWFATQTTDNLAEGSTNLYYTAARVTSLLNATTTTGFSTTSAAYWKGVNNFFSTTSADYLQTQRNYFSTTSASFFASAGLAHSTTSVTYQLGTIDKGYFFSTTSAAAYLAAVPPASFSTTSASYFSSVGLAFSTTSNAYFLSQNQGAAYSTTSADYWSTQRIFFSTTSASFFASVGLAHSTTSVAYQLTQNLILGAATSTSLAATNITATGTASSTNLTVSAVRSALGLFSGTGALSAYGGSSGVCTNQFPTSLSAAGALGGCTSVADAFFSGQLGTAHGGTGADLSGSTGVVVVNSGAVSASSTLAVNRGGTGSTTLTGLLKGNGTGQIQTAVPGTDYLTGNQTITLSGDVSGSGSTAITTAIGANKVTVGMLATAAANTVLGNPTGATGNIQAFATSTLFNNAASGVSGLLTGTDWTSFNSRLSTTTVLQIGNGQFFSTTSASFFSSAGLAFSTTSNSYFASVGLSFSTTSADYWLTTKGVGGFSTTSANYWASVGLGHSTTSVAYQLSQNTTLGNSTSTNFFATLASSTAQYSTNATTSGLYITGQLSKLLTTDAGGQVGGATVNTPLSFSAGTLSIQQGTSAQNGYISSTDWNSFNSRLSTSTFAILVGQGQTFSTTSDSYFASVGLAFSTTSSNYWLTQNTGQAFSTTSATYLLNSTTTTGFSTTSASYFSSLGLAFSTTSANFWSSVGLGHSTTSVAYQLSQNTTLGNSTSTTFFSTTASSTNLSALNGTTTKFAAVFAVFTNATTTNLSATLASSTNLFSIQASTTYLSVASTASTTNLTVSGIGTCTGSNAWQSNSAGTVTCGAVSGAGSPWAFTYSTSFTTAGAQATSSIMGLTGGFYATASSTIGGGGVTSGLTILGNGTTTGSFLISGSATSTNLFATNASTTNATSTRFFAPYASTTDLFNVRATSTTLFASLASSTNLVANFASSTIFAAIDTFKLPTFAALTTAVAGAIGIDTTTGQLRWFDGTSNHIAIMEDDKGFQISTSTAAYKGAFGTSGTTSNILLANFKRARTLTDLYCQGNGATSTIRFGNGSATTTLICGKDIAGSASGLSTSFAARGAVWLDIGTLIGTNGDSFTITPTWTLTSD
ncbi:conserved hypothetical protein [Bradyrhizobium sp. ORS 285]|nr:conserved hypothetical protein [Bradyrhizobium sp. ORS 285]